MKTWLKAIMSLVYAMMVWQPSLVKSQEVLQIYGKTEVPAYSLAKCWVNAPKGVAIVWRITPREKVSRASSPRGYLEFTAPPGVYTVDAMLIKANGDEIEVQEASLRVTITPPILPPIPSPPVPPIGGGTLSPLQAIGRIRFGSSGCTATIIGPRRPDGRWDVLTAAHCVPGVGSSGTMYLKDGRTVAIRTRVVARGPDLCWCITDSDDLMLPYAMLSAKDPEIGTSVYHNGYGVDQPGNKETGKVTGKANPNGQLKFTLSVSSGDSGGAIIREDDNTVVSCVCCTTGRGQLVTMWGASTSAIRSARTSPVDDDWEEKIPPIRDTQWTPLEIPLCTMPADKGP